MAEPPRNTPPLEVTSANDLPSLERFEIRRRLGVGGMGVVYHAWDRERQMHVALKTLRQVDPAGIYRFKNEFRALADVAHPNLVSLYELLSVDGQWLFTMELVHGVDFRAYVRGATPGLEPAMLPSATPWSDETAQSTRELRPSLHTETLTRESPRGLPLLDLGRLRHGLAQLVDGVCALHASGHLHRDIKPSNVLVTADERVVLLDFGVITELAGRRWQTESAVEAVGTPAYVAPEQADGNSVAASDWYSVGVVLYEALTGRRPFRGRSDSVLELKKSRAPERPGTIRSETPEDLDSLCMDLLQPSPERRPSDAELRTRVGLGPRPLLDRSPEPRLELLGRAAQLALLHQALSESRRGGLLTYVHGTSGMGKSALVTRFLDQASADGAVVLAGRCYERESVPYKAVDSLIDSLSRHLLSLPKDEAARFLPRDISMLARMFPVLRRVPAVIEAPRARSAPDPHELRRQAFATLRELLARIAEARPLILFIDDLQWGDADSAPLLEELLRPPTTPRLLMVGAYRTAEADRSPLLMALRRGQAGIARSVRTRTIAVEPLSTPDATELARALLEQRGLDRDLAPIIARESGGVPFFVHEVVRFADAQGGATGGALSLEGVIRGRIEQLDPPARHLLELVAVAGGPIAQRVLQRAAEVTVDRRFALLQILRAAHMVDATGARDSDRVEIYHDRIREVAVAALEAGALRDAHSRLAAAFQREEHPDPETLTYHLYEAGADDAAAEYAAVAAQQAADALAFDRAAELFARALELDDGSDADRRRVLAVQLGDALANAGRGGDAAAAYLRAMEGASPDQALELERRAALHYLRAGHVDEGLEALRRALAAFGERPTKTTGGALAALLWRRARVRLRRLRYRERDPAEIPPQTLAHIDVYWSAAQGLSMFDPLRGADYAARHLLASLRCGEPYRVARSLCWELAFASLSGRPAEKRCLHVLDVVQKIAARLDNPEVNAWMHGSESLFHYQNGRFTPARDSAEQASSILREQCTGIAWEHTSIQLYRIWSLYQLGALRELSDSVLALLDESRQRGDRYAGASIRVGLPNVTWLVADQPDDAMREIDEAMQQWPKDSFHLQHYWALLARAQCDLYRGAGQEAHARVIGAWRDLRRSMLLRIQAVRIEAHHLRARAALAATTGAEDRDALIAAAERDARRIARENVPWGLGVSALIAAGVASARGQKNAPELFETAAERCDAADMGLTAAIARRRAAELSGSSDDPRAAECDQILAREGVVRPQRMMDLLVPAPRPG